MIRTSRRVPPAFALTAAALALLAGCSRVPPVPPPVVLVVIDTLRADHLECYGYGRVTSPALCGLAREGVLFERAYATRTETVPAISSILTGLYPPLHGVRANYSVLPEGVATIAELLRAAGYATGGFVSSFVMIRDFSGFAQGFAVYDDHVRSPEGLRENYERPAPETVDRALAWIAGAGARPFLFVHLIEPHGPYNPPQRFLEKMALPRAGERVPLERIPSSQRLPGVEFVSEFVGRYDGEIAAADAELGRLFEHLRASGRFDESLIVVTADHGESLGEGDVWFSHGERLDDPQARVPLIVKLPAGTGRVAPGTRVAEPVSAVDIVPTILAAVGAPPPAEPLSGTDLLPVARGQRRPGAPPLTERVSRQDLRVMAHDRDCAVHWTIPRRPAPGAARWTEAVSAVAVEPSEAGEPCKERLARVSFERVRDALALAPRFPVTRRTDVLKPGGKTEFIDAREGAAADAAANGPAAPEVPIDARDREALRALGYAE